VTRNPVGALVADPTFRKWLSTVFLVLAGLVLLLVFAFTWSAALSPSPAGCHNAPLRVTRFPQWVGIAVCIAGFVLGRVTARPRIVSRRELRSPVEDGQKHTPEQRENFALLVQGSLTAALLFIGFLIAFEAVTLGSGVWPITYFMRCASEAGSWQALLAAGAFCVLAGRWLWLPAVPKDEA
jgi:uncharacterized membrane protein